MKTTYRDGIAETMENDMTYYVTKASATGGRTGRAYSDDNRLDVVLDTPKELGGAGGAGTNPEQLFAAGYAACFLSALKHLAGQQKLKLDETASVEATVGVGPRPDSKGFGLDLALKVSLPGVDADTAEALVAAADGVCPYSHLARTAIPVALSIA